ncbi:hypothetical protein NHH03_22390 [Stieleria sp. TO1_6]|uniref:hypothetical protein n=1 Tax=Stieleria tagensis TaxID=2956795 RepID=UPI00209AFD89|nr:hypothetical protein [Stieleria tagensis]MCO8124505.1 hypothetical protein [Stieleria tagensis]
MTAANAIDEAIEAGEAKSVRNETGQPVYQLDKHEIAPAEVDRREFEMSRRRDISLSQLLTMSTSSGDPKQLFL